MNLAPFSLLRTLAFALALALVAALATPAVARTSAATAPAGATFDTCSWDRPGVDPFMGDVIAAVDRYQDIAPDVRARLKARMVKREYDDVVSIRRDSITGNAKARYGSTIRDMHFGNAKVCHSVSRAAWSAQMQERGLVYCESGQCILVPTICRNVSRIARAEVAHEHAEGDEPEAPAIVALDLLPTPIPLDLTLEVPAIDGGATAGTSPDGDSQAGRSGGGGGGGGAAGIAGAHGSFASGSSEGPAGAGIAATGSKGDGTPAASQAPADLQATPVPEPETWGLMLGGLGALAAWRRRRRRRRR